MIYVYVDGAPVPLTAYLQVVAESLLGVAHSLICPCQKLPKPVIAHIFQGRLADSLAPTTFLRRRDHWTSPGKHRESSVKPQLHELAMHLERQT
jgi:hypothetical protein